MHSSSVLTSNKLSHVLLYCLACLSASIGNKNSSKQSNPWSNQGQKISIRWWYEQCAIMWQHADWNLCIFCVGFIAGLHKCLVRLHSPLSAAPRPPPGTGPPWPSAGIYSAGQTSPHTQPEQPSLGTSSIHPATHYCARAFWCDPNTTGRHVAVMLANQRRICSVFINVFCEHPIRGKLVLRKPMMGAKLI